MNNYTLPPASAEQKESIKLLVLNNIVIDSVAGSGKTTTVLYIAKCFPEQRILLMTYNAKLKLETREKAEHLGLKNLEVHNYHSFGCKYISGNCSTDMGIINFLRSPGEYELPEYDLVIADETQDMSMLYFKFISRILTPATKICVLGDKFQSIYVYNGADHRFITFADRVFTFNNLPWKHSKLSTSYRITNTMANFLNKCVLRYDRLRAIKAGTLPRYIIGNLFNKPTKNPLLAEVTDYLNIYSPSDIFILAPSVKGGPTSPIRLLANSLSAKGIPIYVPSNDDRKLDEAVLQGKLTFSTFHQAKGLERKVVIVVGFDSSYYEFYNKTAPREICPNELYVALTRASEKLTIFHSQNREYLPFVDREALGAHCQIIGKPGKHQTSANNSIKTPVVDFISHLPAGVLNRAISYLRVTTIVKPGQLIKIDTKSQQTNPFGDTLFEEVSDITGTAIPAYYQYLTSGRIDIHNLLLDAKKTPAINSPLSPAALLQMSNQYCSYKSGLIFRLNQINNYDWLSEENLAACMERMKVISPAAKTEVGIKVNYMGRELIGFIDVIDNGILWELKCVRELSIEHILQTAVYTFMYAAIAPPIFKSHLFNILTGEILEISADNGDLLKMIKLLMHAKYHVSTNMSDNEFLDNICRDHVPAAEPDCHICELLSTNPVTAEPIDWLYTSRGKPTHKQTHL